LGTWSEIRALEEWLQARPEIKSVMVVSSGFHLRRLSLCCRALLPGTLSVRFVAARDPDENLASRRWWRHARMRRWVLSEIGKLMIYAPLSLVTIIRGHGPK
jgi:uncharacterized SAM-binding protein YcdF (DUF218 family)